MSILIVDDSDFVHSQLKILLSSQGMSDLHFAFDAEEAFDFLGLNENDTINTEVDLVLMDVVMPVIDGISAVKRIRSHPELADLPIIMITGDSSKETLIAAFESGASDYLPKPLKRIELIARVNAALKLKRETDSRMAHEQELIRVNANLQEAFERIAEEMDLVATLQGNLLPRRQPRLEGIRIDTLYRSSGRASGDYYDYIQTGTKTIRLVIADVSGHGAQAAFIMAIVRTLFHSGTTMGMTLEGIVTLVNSHLYATSGDDGRFVTVFTADLDLDKKQMQYINAGHCPCLLVNGPGAIEALTPMSPPCGIQETTYKSRSLALGRTGKLFLYTDGLYEWPVEPGRIFGLEPFLLLSEQLLSKKKGFLPSLEANLKTLTGRQPEFTDDLTALLATWDMEQDS